LCVYARETRTNIHNMFLFFVRLCLWTNNTILFLLRLYINVLNLFVQFIKVREWKYAGIYVTKKNCSVINLYFTRSVEMVWISLDTYIIWTDIIFNFMSVLWHIIAKLVIQDTHGGSRVVRRGDRPLQLHPSSMPYGSFIIIISTEAFLLSYDCLVKWKHIVPQTPLCLVWYTTMHTSSRHIIVNKYNTCSTL